MFVNDFSNNSLFYKLYSQFLQLSTFWYLNKCSIKQLQDVPAIVVFLLKKHLPITI